MKKIYAWSNEDDIELVADLIRSGEVIAGTSDTVFGLLAPLTQVGFDKLNLIKGRSEKPYLVLVRDKQNAKQFTDVLDDKKIASIVDHYWPGPLTIVVPAKKNVPDFIVSKTGTIALRVPKHDGLQKLLAFVPGLFSTSANKAGYTVPARMEDMDPSIKKAVAGIIIGEVVHDQPSTIIDVTGDKVIVVRAGAIDIQEE